MRRHTVVFAASGNLGASRARWLGPIESHWPGDDFPEVRPQLLDTFVESLESATSCAQPPEPTTALLVFGPDDSPRTIDRAVEAMLARSLPGVVLLEDPSAWRPFQRHGILYESWSRDPAVLAAMLFSLAERQSVVSVLAREIAISQRCHGGIRTEMERLHEELHLAALLQREFTSSAVPKVPGLDIGVLFRPVNFVSGDVYTVQDLGNNQAAFFIADAVGHGVPAALLTMVLTNSLITTEFSGTDRRVLEPIEVLSRLNRRLCDSCLGSGRFATALYGVLDAVTGMVHVAGAGHPYPLVLSPGMAREIVTQGPLLGVFPEAHFTQASFRLAPQETLLLYTDGLEAAFPRPLSPHQNPFYRGRNYLEQLANLVAPDTDQRSTLSLVLGELGHLLDEQLGSLHQVDDVTALAISPAQTPISRPVQRPLAA